MEPSTEEHLLLPRGTFQPKAEFLKAKLFLWGSQQGLWVERHHRAPPASCQTPRAQNGHCKTIPGTVPKAWAEALRQASRRRVSSDDHIDFCWH